VAVTNWLVSAKNLTELKAQYHNLARQHHPDLGGDTEIMQQINAEYSLRVKLFKAGFNVAATPTPTEPASRPRKPSSRKNTCAENATEWDKLGISRDAYEAYQAVCQMREAERYPFGIVIKIVRGQVQVGGKATYFYRERLKALGFLWNSSARYWFFVKKPATSKAV
jgi:hypothetical protein